MTASKTLLPEEATVLRLADRTNPKQHPKPGKCGRAAWHLSSEDKAQTPPTLSVWDTARTTLLQAIAIRKHPRPQIGFTIDVATVCGATQVLVEKGDPGADQLEPLAVIHEPLDKVEPGSDGHCGVLNLYPSSIPNAAKLRKRLAHYLAASCVAHSSG